MIAKCPSTLCLSPSFSYVFMHTMKTAVIYSVAYNECALQVTKFECIPCHLKEDTKKLYIG